MILNELTRPTISQTVLALQDKGYEEVGRGLCGHVWAKPGSSTALKVFTKIDGGYRMFANVVMANPNPHFPRLSGKLIRLNDHYFAIRMELLEPLASYESLHAITSYVMEHNDREPPSAEWVQKYKAELEITRECVFGEFPHLQQACDILLATVLKKFNSDIHGNNIMQRGRLPVIIDPVVGMDKSPRW
jgi:hypothetical protein